MSSELCKYVQKPECLLSYHSLGASSYYRCYSVRQNQIHSNQTLTLALGLKRLSDKEEMVGSERL